MCAFRLKQTTLECPERLAATLTPTLTPDILTIQHSSTYETGLSDHHHMITTFMRAHLVRLQPKRIMYRSYKNFNESLFLEDIQNTGFYCDSEDPNMFYESLVQKFKKIVDKHAPFKQKTLRDNQAPFMNKNLRKAIYTRSRLKNNFNKKPTSAATISHVKPPLVWRRRASTGTNLLEIY